jgi:hypothetical protein
MNFRQHYPRHLNAPLTLIKIIVLLLSQNFCLLYFPLNIVISDCMNVPILRWRVQHKMLKAKKACTQQAQKILQELSIVQFLKKILPCIMVEIIQDYLNNTNAASYHIRRNSFHRHTFGPLVPISDLTQKTYL